MSTNFATSTQGRLMALDLLLLEGTIQNVTTPYFIAAPSPWCTHARFSAAVIYAHTTDIQQGAA
jgi:hypothetical protein